MGLPYAMVEAYLVKICRAGMERMRVAIQSNGLTELHRTWGGSHDFLLGCLLWLVDMPTYSFGR